jgi:putative flippase GtrA
MIANLVALTESTPWIALRRRSASVVLFGISGGSGILVNNAALVALVHLHVGKVLALILASAISTTSNFLSNELLVFRNAKRTLPQILMRYVGYSLLTVVTLPVRVPLFVLLVSYAGLHYVVANLVTIAVQFGFRFAVCDLLIWRRGAATLRADRWGAYNYDIDGVIKIASAARLPELDFFRTDSVVTDPDLVVHLGAVGSLRPRLRREIQIGGRNWEKLAWKEHLGALGADFRVTFGSPVRVTVGPLLALSPHVIYTNLVEPLLRFLLVAKGRMLLHAATVVLDGKTIMLSAETDTGKTSTILQMLQERGEGVFLSDDMVILDRSGSVSRYPKPLTISAHTVRSTPANRLKPISRLTLPLRSRLHSRGGRGTGKWLSTLNLPIMALNAAVQALVPPPKYMVTDLVDCRIGTSAPIQNVFLIERGTESWVNEVGPEETVDVLIRNTDDAYGFPPYNTLAPYITIGGLEHSELLRREREILTEAIAGRSLTRIVASGYGWARVIEQRLGLEPRGPESAMGQDVVAAGSASR